MSPFKKSLSICVALLGIAATGPMARAAFTVTMQQIGPDVVATGSGSIDYSGLSYSNTVNNDFSFVGFVQPALDEVAIGPPVSPSVDLYIGTILGPPVFGPGNSYVLATSGSGDTVFSGGSNFRSIGVPEGYISGNPLLGTSTFSGQTLNTMGIIPGTYTWTWGSGPTADSFTIIAIPEPASLGLLGVGSLSLLVRRRRA